MSSKPELKDYNEGRGKREGAPLGTTVFIGLRALDPLVQRTLLLSAPLTTLLPKLGLSAPIPPPNAPIVPLTGLSPLHSVIWFMSIGSAVKQCFYLVFTSKERMFLPLLLRFPLLSEPPCTCNASTKRVYSHVRRYGNDGSHLQPRHQQRQHSPLHCLAFSPIPISTISDIHRRSNLSSRHVSRSRLGNPATTLQRRS